MRSLLLLLISGSLLAFVSACTSTSNQTSSDSMQPIQASVSGVLIDQACGTKMLADADPEKSASAHPKSCATADACAASGYAVISGKDMIKFDDNGNKLAKDFLAKTDKTDNLRVVVQGVRTGNTIAVTSISAAS
jgi:hypothetical protein